MRYDLEVVVTNRLTAAGKEKIANLFYNNEYTDNIAPFNSVVLRDIPYIKSNSPLINGYKYMLNVIPENFISRVNSLRDFNVDRLIIKRGAIIPFLTYGSCFFHRSNARLSNNSVKSKLELNAATDLYEIEIPDDVLISSISLKTSRLSSGGNADDCKVFNFVDVSVINVMVVAPSELPLVYTKNTLFMVTTDGIHLDSLHGTINNSIVKQIEAPGGCYHHETWEEVVLFGDEGALSGDIGNKRIYARYNNKTFNLVHKLAFATSNHDYKYLVEVNPYNNKRTVYTNTGEIINSQNIEQFTIAQGNSKLVFLEEYPSTLISTQESTIGDVIYKQINNVVKMTSPNHIESGFYDISTLTYSVIPTIAYDRTIWDREKDVRHLKIDFSPKSLNFADGTICLISTDGDKNCVADSLELIFEENNLMAPFGSKKVTARLKSLTGLPIPNRKVSITIGGSVFEYVKWATTESDTFEANTNLSGEISGLLISTSFKLGNYIQKQHVGNVASIDASGNIIRNPGNNILYIPYNIGTTNINDVYLFFVLGDDPLLGQIREKNGNFGLAAESFVMPEPSDHYGTALDVTSYVISGRKVAYVQLSSAVTGTSLYEVKSSHIKPTSIEVFGSRNFLFKKLYLYNTSLDRLGKQVGVTYTDILTDTVGANFWNIANPTVVDMPVSQWDQDWLLTPNKFEYFSADVSECTMLTFDDDIPGINDENVLGYFLKIKSPETHVDLVATYVDPVYETVLSQASSALTIGSFAINEDAFALSTEPNGKLNSYIGPYSYLTLSDYVNTPEGTNYTTYVCKYSGRIIGNPVLGNRCNHPIGVNRSYYTPNNGDNFYCRHSVEWDLTQAEQDRCPGLDAQLINPFVLYYSGN